MYADSAREIFAGRCLRFLKFLIPWDYSATLP